jgi:hypothetical protein
MPDEAAAVSSDDTFIRDPDFTSLYANNIRIERSVWDLKLIFGELDQSRDPNVVIQHTSMSMPWLQAKLLSYYLELNLAIHEADYGHIRVPEVVVPALPVPANPTPGVTDNPALKPVLELLVLLHKKYFGPWGVTPQKAAEEPGQPNEQDKK